jgi:enamine deaminase RidA (YjgF/YER057c/UK114 family)
MSREIQRVGTTARWSDIVIHNNVVYLVEIPTVEGDITSQTVSLLSQVKDSLLKVNSSPEHMLMCTIYIANIEDVQGFNAVWDSWVPAGCAPVRACVQIARLVNPSWLVEIQVTAAIPSTI